MDLRPRFPAILPAALRDAISDLWHRNPARRPGWGEVGDLTRGALEAGAPPAAALDKRGSDIFEARRCGVLDSDSRLFESEAPPSRRTCCRSTWCSACAPGCRRSLSTLAR